MELYVKCLRWYGDVFIALFSLSKKKKNTAMLLLFFSSVLASTYHIDRLLVFMYTTTASFVFLFLYIHASLSPHCSLLFSYIENDIFEVHIALVRYMNLKTKYISKLVLSL